MKYFHFLALTLAGLWACSPKGIQSDAWGTFEAREVLVSAEASGPLVQYAVRDGQQVTSGEVLGMVDTMALYLRKVQLEASIRALGARTQDIGAQRAVFEVQKQNLDREIDRVTALIASGAATSKQLDDLKGQREVVERQMNAQVTTLSTANTSVRKEAEPLLAQLSQVNDQIKRCVIKSPISGTVLANYAEQGEMAMMGRVLFKVADMNRMTLRAYLSGDQLDSVRLGQKVALLAGEDTGEKPSFEGELVWVSDVAEFTPKTIQTRKERTALVYAIKVETKNDGRLKIGMPGEVLFRK